MIPCSLYIHTPWCIQKCPYCDFNSHKSPDKLPEEEYIERMIADLKNDIQQFGARPIHTIFIGGGTPSLFSASTYDKLLSTISGLLPFQDQIEITIEANPGTMEQQRFKDYRALGINRLSLGIQSFNPRHLKSLGRIHGEVEAHRAIEFAKQAGFERINLDIMHGLPNQTVAEGIEDLETAIQYETEHLSWYQLTIEPNTVFYKRPPSLPNEDDAYQLEQEGLARLQDQHFKRYEISAYCRRNQVAKHNMNYWLFGDYFGIGAGAHGKISLENSIYRTTKYKQPTDYLNLNKPFHADCKKIAAEDLMFEFMLNTTRLEEPISAAIFEERTRLSFKILYPKLLKAQSQGLLELLNNETWRITPFGRRFTNNLQALFLPVE